VPRQRHAAGSDAELVLSNHPGRFGWCSKSPGCRVRAVEQQPTPTSEGAVLDVIARMFQLLDDFWRDDLDDLDVDDPLAT
jgi:hypothetical protein